MTAWEPPDAGAAVAPPAAPFSTPYPTAPGYGPYGGGPGGPPPAWGQPWPGTPSGPGDGRWPWYRSTLFLILGGLALLGFGGIVGATLAAIGLSAADSAVNDFGSVATTYGRGGDLAAFTLTPGECASRDVYEASSYGEDAAVSCVASHGAEHYASVTPPVVEGSASAYAADDLTSFADRACYLAFRPYVGIEYADSDFDYVSIVPTAAAWTTGTRAVHCVLVSVEGTMTRWSARNSRR